MSQVSHGRDPLLRRPAAPIPASFNLPLYCKTQCARHSTEYWSDGVSFRCSFCLVFQLLLLMLHLFMSPPTSLGFYAPSRDSNGIPVIRETSKSSDTLSTRIYSDLLGQSQSLWDCYNAIDFLRPRVLPVGGQHASYHIARAHQSYKLNITVNEELQSLPQLLQEHTTVLKLLLDLQRALATYQLGPVPPSRPRPRPSHNPFLPPQMLLRACSLARSHSPHSDEFGFQSSGFGFCRPKESVEALIESGILSKTSLRNHCEGVATPSYWVSLTDNPQWLLKKSALCKAPYNENDERCIAFINVEKLNRMGIIYQRSDLLALQAKILVYSKSNESGVMFTSVDHWLAYAWIPPQCIERVTSLQRFRYLYEAHGFEDPSIFFLSFHSSH